LILRYAGIAAGPKLGVTAHWPRPPDGTSITIRIVLLQRLTPRHFRILGLVVIAAGIPSCITFWMDQGWTWGVVILGMHLYVGAFLVLAIPWLQARRP
jgi:hypothetical protein